MRMWLRNTGLTLLRRFIGMNLVDQRTGKVVARVVVLPWRGTLRIIGLEEASVRPHFLPQNRERYWAQDLGFSTWPPPDFPNETAIRAEAVDPIRSDFDASSNEVVVPQGK